MLDYRNTGIPQKQRDGWHGPSEVPLGTSLTMKTPHNKRGGAPDFAKATPDKLPRRVTHGIVHQAWSSLSPGDKQCFDHDTLRTRSMVKQIPARRALDHATRTGGNVLRA